MLSDRAIQEYRDIARRHGVELSLEEASHGGEWLVRLYIGLFKPSETNVQEPPSKCAFEA